jgi:microcystin degradation protein MlrC
LTKRTDPAGNMAAMVREVVGPESPVVVIFDLQANISDAMVQSVEVFLGYRTNPPLDI